MRTATRTAGAVLVAVLLAACDGDGAASPGGSPTAAASGRTEATPAPTSEPVTSASPTGDAGTATEGSSVATSQAAFEPVSVDVDEEFRDKGVEVTLEGVDVQPDGLFFRISAFNGSDRTAQLAVSPDAVYATDGSGDRLRFQPPGDNATLSFEPGETLTARLGFAARLREVPRVAAVWFNYTDDSTPVEPRDDVTVVSATFNNLFLRRAQG